MRLTTANVQQAFTNAGYELVLCPSRWIKDNSMAGGLKGGYFSSRQYVVPGTTWVFANLKEAYAFLASSEV